MNSRKKPGSAAASEEAPANFPGQEAEIRIEPDGSVCFLSLFAELLPVALALEPELASFFKTGPGENDRE
jgi:hypothetical protein